MEEEKRELMGERVTPSKRRESTWPTIEIYLTIIKPVNAKRATRAM